MMEPIAAANTPEWKELRRSGIGASESAAACGLSRWKQPLELWGEKVFGFEAEENDAMLIGRMMEPVVADLFQLKTGLQVQTQPGLFRHPDIEWLLASPDGILPDGRLTEFKTTTSRNEDYGEPGTDQVPIEVLCQNHQQLAVTGAPAVLVAVLFLDTRELKQYNVERHTRIQDGLINREAKFWDCVKLETPPPIDLKADGAAAAVRRAFRTVSEGKAIDLDDEAVFLADCIDEHGESIRKLEKTRDEIKAALALKMQDAEVGRMPDGRTVVRKAVEATVKEHVRRYVTLTVKKGSK